MIGFAIVNNFLEYMISKTTFLKKTSCYLLYQKAVKFKIDILSEPFGNNSLSLATLAT
jgi:hypothetical protein